MANNFVLNLENIEGSDKRVSIKSLNNVKFRTDALDEEVVKSSSVVVTEENVAFCLGIREPS